MGDEKEKAFDNDQETMQPAEGTKVNPSEEDLKKVSGGSGFDKWFQFD